MRKSQLFLLLIDALFFAMSGPIISPLRAAEARAATAADVLAGLRKFFGKTARADGSFANGLDPQYRGTSDSAYGDLAAVTYAVITANVGHERRSFERGLFARWTHHRCGLRQWDGESVGS